MIRFTSAAHITANQCFSTVDRNSTSFSILTVIFQSGPGLTSSKVSKQQKWHKELDCDGMYMFQEWMLMTE